MFHFLSFFFSVFPEGKTGNSEKREGLSPANEQTGRTKQNAKSKFRHRRWTRSSGVIIVILILRRYIHEDNSIMNNLLIFPIH